MKLRPAFWTLLFISACGAAEATAPPGQELPLREPSDGGGDSAAPAAEAAAPATTVTFDSPVWQIGESGTVRVPRVLGPVTLRAFDTEGKLAWQASTDGTADRNLAVDVDEVGYYRLEVDGSPSAEEVSFVVQPKRGPTVPKFHIGFGVNTHFGQRDVLPIAYPLLQKLGVDFVRDEIGWGGIEKDKGVFAFQPRHDLYTSELAKAGIELVFSASYGNKLYPMAGRYPDGAEAVAAYARYVTEVVKRYGSNLRAVELLNEPHTYDAATQYYPLLKTTFEALRAAGLGTYVIAVGGAGIGNGMVPDYAARVFDEGGASFCNGFSQHPYTAPHAPDIGYPGGPPSNVANLNRALTSGRDLLARFGKQRGGWVTEMGWSAPLPKLSPAEMAALESKDPTHTLNMVSLGKQAAFTARALLDTSRFDHMDGFILYDFQDDGPDPNRREHRFGLVRQDFTPKPAYAAFATARGFLDGKTFVRRVFSPDALMQGNVYRDAAGGVWLAIWNTEVTEDQVRGHATKVSVLAKRYFDAEHQIAFESSIAPVSAHDWQGRQVVVSPEMITTSRPLYLRLPAGSESVTVTRTR